MIRNAVAADLPQIMEIVEAAKSDMHSYDNYQWDESYPKEEDFMRDLTEGSLYVCDMDGSIAGVVCINKDEPEEYKRGNWSMSGEALVIHRLAVDTKFLGKGIAYQLMNHADVIGRQNHIAYIRTDTNSLNIKAQSLLKKCGYVFAGEITLSGHEGTFYCYDKVL